MNSRQKGRGWRFIGLAFVLAFACVVCAAGVLALDLWPRVLIAALGLRHAGSLETVLPTEQDALLLAGQLEDRVEVVMLPQIPDPLPLTSVDLGTPVVGDASTPGTTAYLLTIREDSLNQLLSRGIFSGQVGSSRYRDLEIDLQPGGLVIYGDVDLGLRWHRMGLLFLQESGVPAVSPAGVVRGRELYELPEGRSLARTILPAGRQIRRALQSLTIVGPLPGEARVEEVRFYRDRIQILARATYPAPAPVDTGWQSLEPGVELREIDVVVEPERPAERLHIVRLDPGQVEFRVRYDPANPRLVSAWASDTRALVVVNGGYFAPQDEGGGTIGLLISDGQGWGTPLGSYAGMFAVTSNGGVSVRSLQQSPFDPQEPLAHAVQSFPVLVKPGGVMGFPADGDDGVPARRTAVAQDRAGNILFIVATRGYLSLHELAVFLAESDLAIDVALNLDGGGSTGMWTGDGDVRVQIDSFSPVPSVITAQRP